MIINDIQFNCTLEQILDELQHQVRLKQLLYLERGYKRSGDHLMIQCPYHSDGQERRPSAGIRESDGMFHCFSCGEVHDLPQVISHCLGYSDITGKEGLKWLVKNFATVEVEERKDVELDLSRNTGSSSVVDTKNYVTDEELDNYRYTHPYMYERGLTDDVIELFDIGYDHGSDSITFPVRDINGNCLFVARRSVKSKWYNYPKGVEKPLYGLYEYHKDIHDKTYVGKCTGQEITSGKYMLQSLPVIVCEGMFDALTCWVHGKYAVALNGTGNELQFKQLRQLPCRKLILATDNDEAGQRARSRIRANVKNKIITEYVLPRGKKDINELSKKEFNDLEEIF